MKAAISIFFLVGSIFYGNAQPQTDSLFKKAYPILFENPGKAIDISQIILQTKDATEENKADALLLISTAYTSERNYAKSLEYAVSAEEQLPKIGSDDFKINIYSRLGIQYQQLKIYNKAHSYLDKAISVVNNTKQPIDKHKLLGFNYAIRGMVYKEQMSCDFALDYFNKSLYHNKKSEQHATSDANISIIIYNKGNCFLSLNKIDSARTCFISSYEYADKIHADHLKAFANKGLAEVNTLEGHYENAIGLLLEASEMSADVDDQVLNQGIYRGLSDNYLFTNAISRHKWYERKYQETTQRIKKDNAKTLNQLVLQINVETQTEMEHVKSKWLYYQIPLIIFVFILAAALFFEIFRGRKRYNHLDTLREKLGNLPSANG
jgi:tetratricopeptide (TPR) repeat protein